MPPEDASILHADLDAFYASVEQRDDPRLRNRPVIVGGGVVLACSYEAKARGVRTAMSGRQAKRLCPDAVVVDPDGTKYADASKAVFEIFHDTTPMVEGLSIDEAFLDVSGLWRIRGAPREIATVLRRRVRSEVGLILSVGVATTKFLAKVASAVSKPDGLLVIAAGTEQEFLDPLPVARLWGVGPITEAKLADRGIHTVAQVRAVPTATLVSWLGSGVGHKLHALARNRDPRRIDTARRRRSIGSQRSMHIRNQAHAVSVLNEIADGVSRRLRRADRVGRTVVLRLRFEDFQAVTRSHTLAQATDASGPIHRTAERLLDEIWPEAQRRRLNRVGLSVANLSDANAVQLAFPLGGPRPVEVDHAMDAIADRFGSGAIRRLSRPTGGGFPPPLLGD